MDRFALAAANAIVGNALSAAALEWGLAGGSLRFDSDATLALGGAIVSATLAGEPVAPFTTLHARPGDELVVQQFDSGRFLYVAVHGGIDVPIVLHSRSTYLPGRFGGFEGRLLRHGDSIRVGIPAGGAPDAGFHAPGELTPAYTAAVVHVTRGPQAELFDDVAWQTFLGEDYRVASASDRTGYRLEGRALSNPAPTLPSEPSCQGAIQISGDGRPIVLMADAPTVGGYPRSRSCPTRISRSWRSGSPATACGSSSSRSSRASARRDGARPICRRFDRWPSLRSGARNAYC